LVQIRDRTDQPGGGSRAPGPGQDDIDVLAVAFGGDQYAFQQAAQQFFAVGVGRGRCGPERRDATGQAGDRGQLVRAQRCGTGGEEPFVVLGQLAVFGQRVLPVGLQLAGDQPVLRLGQLVLAPGPVTGDLRAFPAQLPEAFQLVAFGLQAPGGLGGQFQRGGSEYGQHLTGHPGVQERSAHLLTGLQP
jgi:hypothetical protein